MTLFTSEAVVLRVSDYGESDKIVTLYAAHQGRITGIAKGARRSKRRFVNKLEIFSLLEIQFETRNQAVLPVIREAELLQSFHPLRNAYGRYLAATLLTEAMLAWTREHDADASLFSLLVWTLEALASRPRPLEALTIFFARLAAIQGYQPHFSCCRTCGSIATGLYFLPHQGGVVCERCSGAEAGGIYLSAGTAKLLENAMTLPLGTTTRLRFPPLVLDSALSLLIRYHQSLLQRVFRSWQFFRQADIQNLPST